MAEQLPSIVDVARKAGVSVATASRVMSSSTYPVSTAARQKVLQAAEELNYVPNSLARSLKAQRSKLIAVIVGNNSDPYFAQITRGVEEIANNNGYLTIVCNTDRSPERELTYLQTLQDYRADGIIFAASGSTASEHTSINERINAITDKIQARGGAIITLSQHVIEAPSIQPDNFQGAHDMIAHLIAQGHQRIAIVTGPLSLIAASVRLQGYKAALSEADIPFDATLVIPGTFTQSGGMQAADTLHSMALEQRPTAVFASNDEMAFGIIMQLQQLGWHIPEDISVCGFGDLPVASLIAPTLTTVRIGLKELGHAGAMHLLAQLNQEDVQRFEQRPTTIIERASSAPRKGFRPDTPIEQQQAAN